MAITSFYLLNMFPRMRTLLSSPNYQHSTPKPNMFPRMRTLHHHPTINTHHPDKTCSLRCALYIITYSQHSTAMTVIQQISPSNSLANSSSRSRWSSRIGKIPPMKSVTRFPSFVSTINWKSTIERYTLIKLYPNNIFYTDRLRRLNQCDMSLLTTA